MHFEAIPRLMAAILIGGFFFSIAFRFGLQEKRVVVYVVCSGMAFISIFFILIYFR